MYILYMYEVTSLQRGHSWWADYLYPIQYTRKDRKVDACFPKSSECLWSTAYMYMHELHGRVATPRFFKLTFINPLVVGKIRYF